MVPIKNPQVDVLAAADVNVIECVTGLMIDVTMPCPRCAANSSR